MEYIGIDVHKVHSQICRHTDTGDYEEQRIRTERHRFAEFLGGRPPARVLLEASTERLSRLGAWRVRGCR